MITTEGLTTTVEFGDENKARIGFGHRGNDLTFYLDIRELAVDNLKIGDRIPNKEDIKELPKVALKFHKTESIDVVIKQLEILKKAAIKAQQRIQNQHASYTLDQLDLIALAT